ncbi:hypothetical protein [Cellulophaga sp. HaHa_2_1]|uniref:hypothetical protein n=1 Tax=Cellulophaga sp. HaHa_2_1 TaxID=2749994 RepID=UPI001C4FAACD|nr:hypothetical protein [Cellulophaga sp. HaHa_2_1]QXP50492.1 hypothetical protein H0I24_09995 [Cellulophaga sp. HaHa_2_1]
MKNLILIIAIVLTGISVSSAQIRNENIKIPSKTPINPSLLDGNLNLETIKKHISSGKLCYTINMGLTAIFPPRNLTPVRAIDARYAATNLVMVEQNYLRSNGLLLRSDKNFNRNFGNNFEVLIYPKRNDSKKIDENQVKLTWNIPESQLRTFNLINVSIRYKPNGILITGSYEVDEIIFGISIALIPNSCIN